MVIYHPMDPMETNLPKNHQPNPKNPNPSLEGQEGIQSHPPDIAGEAGIRREK